MAEYYAQPVEYPNPPPQPDGRVEPRPAGVPAHAHEGTDVNIRPLVYTGVGLVIFLVAACVFLVFLFDLYSVVERKGVPVTTGVEGAQVDAVTPNAPPLQGVPGFHANTAAKDMEEFRAKNAELLTTYSTAKDGVARIPVLDPKTGQGGVAMDLAIQRGLFKLATAPTTAPADAGAKSPTPAGAGEHKAQ